ncbi:uncharacterized protein LOC127265137 [Andrographis paniculata]|uniref:uncharacterized protein LOC127265137 n=1 Tax=Andrographis paniculata TaxID=175694 RepID=UPI0021E7CE1C|nr:uncharacterized protein LOC127265137 [Andrographis paniculata]
MNSTGDWKSLRPISSMFSAPLLTSSKGSEATFGPLRFTPDPNSSTTLHFSQSIGPSLPPRYPQLSFSRFLQKCNSVPCPATSIASIIRPLNPNPHSHYHRFNSLQMLQIPGEKLIVLFFPAGENSDCVGTLLLPVKDENLNALSQKKNCFQVVKEGNLNNQRITQLLVTPADVSVGYDYGDTLFGDCRNNANLIVGYLMARTEYSVIWYRVRLCKDRGRNEYIVCMDYLGCADPKMLRGSAVVGSCWSPHFRNECLILLENGDLLLFNVDYSSEIKGKSKFVTRTYVSKIIKVSLNNKVILEEKSSDKELQWFGCEFGWHPRIFITCHRKEMFMVDMRTAGECNVCSLLKIETSSTYKNDGFLTLSRAGSDGFHFAVATKKVLLLYDVQKPLMPPLSWVHRIRNPRYIVVYQLAELRANAKDSKYNLASESGYCIMLGSFWDNEFSLFCYGPDISRNLSVNSETNSFLAWGDPLEFSLSGSDCNCGSCIVHEEFLKDSLLAWIDWRQKKIISLGFGILHPDLYAQLSSPDNFGGFVLIRLTSSGKLEAQRYVAAWKPEKLPLIGHKRKLVSLLSEDNNLLYNFPPSEYNGKKKFQHLKLEYLNACLKDNLAELIVGRRQNRGEHDQGSQIKQHVYKSEYMFHQEMCDKLKNSGLPRTRTSLTIPDVMKDITLPTSVRDIALRSIYASLPMNLLQMTFSTYTDLNEDSKLCKEPLEFLGIPHQSELPPCAVRKPSDRCNKWSSKSQPTNDALVGPIIPPQYLASLHKIYKEELERGTKPYLEEAEAFSVQAHIKLQCDKVMDIVREHVSGPEAKPQDDEYVSLADDDDNMSYADRKMKFAYHKPSAFAEHPLSVDEHYGFSTHVFKRNKETKSDFSPEMVGEEIFDMGCPIELKFKDSPTGFSQMELEAFKKLKIQELDFMKSFKIYQDYINQGPNLKQ